MERRRISISLASLAVTVSLTACTAEQLNQLGGLAQQAMAQADMYVSSLLANGQTTSLKPQDLAEIQVNGKAIDLNKVQLGQNGQWRIQGLAPGDNVIKIRKAGGQGYVTVPVIVNEDGSLTIVSTQIQFDASGNPTEATGGQADASGNLTGDGFAFKQTGDELYFRDPKAGNVQQFDLKQGQFKRGQGQAFSDSGQDAFRSQVPKVKLQTDRTFSGQLVRMKIGDNAPPPFAFRLQDGYPVADIAAFGPALKAGQVPRPPVTVWIKGSDNTFKKYTIDLQTDVQGPKQGAIQPPPQGGQQPGMQPDQAGQQPGMQSRPAGPAPQPANYGFGYTTGFGIKQASPQGGQGGMQPPPPGGQNAQGGQPPQQAGQPPQQGQQQAVNGRPPQPAVNPFEGLPALQTIQAKVLSEETANEADVMTPPPPPPANQPGAQPAQGGMQPGGMPPQQGGQRPPQGGMQPPPQGGQNPQNGMQPQQGTQRPQGAM